MRIFICLLLAFSFAVLLSGCCGIYGLIPGNNNSTISPAGDLTGTWRGTASFREDVEGAQCTTTGSFTLNLQQDGNDLAGDYVFSGISISQKRIAGNYDVPPVGCAGPADNELSGQVSGTASSSSLTLDSGGLRQFSGSFTSDIMSLSLTRCLVNDEPCTVASGSQWKITLTRQ